MDPATLEYLIVREIRKAREISRKDLAELLDIAKSTAGRRIDSMIERGIVTEIGIENRKEVGRPRRFLALRGDFGGFIGLDFDARNLFAVFIDFAQTTIEQRKIRLSAKPTAEEVLTHFRSLIREFTANRDGLPIRGIGIGVPGHLHREARTGLHYEFIDDWKDVDLLKELDLTPDLLQIENNTRAIALGEYWLGPHSAAKHLVCISVRTGISSAVIANGEIVSGRNEKAGEIRGWMVPTGDRETPSSHCIEKVGTMRAVTNGSGITDESWHEFLKGCREGDAEALNLLTRLAGMHGDIAARFVQLLDPEVIFFSGPFTELDDIYLDRVREATTTALTGHYFETPPIRRVSLGEFAGAQGAAALAASESRQL